MSDTYTAIHTACLNKALSHLFGKLHTMRPNASALQDAIHALQTMENDTILGENDRDVIRTLLGDPPPTAGITAGTLRARALHELIHRAGLRNSVTTATLVTSTPFGPVAEYAGTLERVSAPGEELTPLNTTGYYAQFDVEHVPHPRQPALLLRANLISVRPARICGTETAEYDLAYMLEIHSGRTAGTVPSGDRWTVLTGLSEDAPDLLSEAWADATGTYLSAAQITAHFKGRLHD